MKRIRLGKYLIVCFSIYIFLLISCRKKNERYEGYYVGTEQYTYLDSGETVFSTDTIYIQEYSVTYSKKMYTFQKMLNQAGETFMISKNEFDNHEYHQWNSPNYIRFSGDSIYIYTTNFSDYIENWDTEVWDFKGKQI